MRHSNPNVLRCRPALDLIPGAGRLSSKSTSNQEFGAPVSILRETERALKRPDCGQYLVGMPVDLHIAPDIQHAAIRADQNRGANNAEEGPAIHRFFAPDPVRLQHLMLFIRDPRSGELVLVAKGFLRLGPVS